MQAKVDLSKYDNSWYNPGPIWKRVLWYFTNELFLKWSLIPVSSLKTAILRLFGAKIGRNVLIKPGVSVKYPWLLEIGDNTWIGEKVWIDNLATTRIGSNVCISQDAMLLCGNHDYTKLKFDLIVKEITLEDGSWIGARSVVCGGVTVGTHAVLAVGSMASRDLDPYSIYMGVPAAKIRERMIGQD